MIIGLVRAIRAMGPDSLMDLGPGVCFTCGATFTSDPVDSLAVDEQYHILGMICPLCLQREVMDLQQVMRLYAEHLQTTDPLQAQRLEALSAGRIWKPAPEELVEAEQDEAGWAEYIDDCPGGFVYSAWFGVPIDATDEDERTRRLWHPGQA